MRRSFLHRARLNGRRGFSMIEMMVSIAILLLILVVVFEIVEKTRSTFVYSQAKVSQFRTARTVFENMTRRISQAVLNTYWDYDNPANPRRYQKQSELHFVVGPAGTGGGQIPELLGGGLKRPSHGIFFQGPFNHSSDDANRSFHTLLNSWGYYIEFGGDEKHLPPFLRGRLGMRERFRFRLMEFRPPTEKMMVYRDDLKNQNQSFDFHRWFRDLATGDEDYSRPIAENVVALIISPRRSRNDLALDSGNDVEWDIAPDYYYNSREFQRNPDASEKRHQLSRHQLPSLLQITMVTIDEASAIRLEIRYGDSVPDLQLASLFHDVSKYDEDLETMEGALRDLGLNYHVFTNTIIMRAAKWSSVVED